MTSCILTCSIIFSCTSGPIFVQLMFYIPTQKCFFWSPCTCASTVPAEFPPGFRLWKIAVRTVWGQSEGAKWPRSPGSPSWPYTPTCWVTAEDTALITAADPLQGIGFSIFLCFGGKSSHTESCPKVKKIIFKTILAKSFKVFIIRMGYFWSLENSRSANSFIRSVESFCSKMGKQGHA